MSAGATAAIHGGAGLGVSESLRRFVMLGSGSRMAGWLGIGLGSAWCGVSLHRVPHPIPSLPFHYINSTRQGWAALSLFPSLSFPLLALYRLDSTRRIERTKTPCVYYSPCSPGCSLHACAWRLPCSMLGTKVVRLSRIPRRAVPLCLARRRRIGLFTTSSGCRVRLSCLCFWVRGFGVGVVVVVVVKDDMR
jgi:hypothetical protein